MVNMRYVRFVSALLCLCPAGLATMADDDDRGKSDGPDPVEERILSDDGGWGYNGPYAVMGRGKLFWSYMNTKGVVCVASYDPASGEIERSEVWETARDLHQASPVLIRPDGRIQMFVNEGGPYTDDRIYWKVSEKPWSVRSFGELQRSHATGVPQGRQFYPFVHEASGDIYLVVNSRQRGGRRVSMWKSTDGGDSFEEHHVLYGLSDDLRNHRCYTRAYMEGDDIHFVSVRVGWGEAVGEHAIGRVEGIYYVRYDVAAEAFYRANGVVSFRLEDAPVLDTGCFDVIWDWEKDGRREQRAKWSDVVARNGRAYVAFAVQDAVPRGEVSLHDGYWATHDEEGRWDRHMVASPLARGIFDSLPPRCNYSIAIDPENPETLFVAKSMSSDGLLSQVYRMATSDGGRTWETMEALSGEGRITTLVVPRRTDDTPRVFDVLWLNGRMQGWSGYQTHIATHPR